MNSIKTGKIGENIAYKYLLENGYLILTRNYKDKLGEIDIIARDSSGILIFCEVKTLNNKGIFKNGFVPEDNLSQAKYRKMVRASGIFIARHPRLVWDERGWQIDLVAVVLKNGKLPDLRHYKNI